MSFVSKRGFSYQIVSHTATRSFSAVLWLILRGKTVFVNICPVLLLCTKKKLFTTNPIFPLDLPLF